MNVITVIKYPLHGLKMSHLVKKKKKKEKLQIFFPESINKDYFKSSSVLSYYIIIYHDILGPFRRCFVTCFL